MNKLLAWLFDRCRAASMSRLEDHGPYTRGNDTLGSNGVCSKLRAKGMAFSIIPAQGGYALEYAHWDELTGDFDGRLHIITDNDDLGDSISKIITLELLRR